MLSGMGGCVFVSSLYMRLRPVAGISTTIGLRFSVFGTGNQHHPSKHALSIIKLSYVYLPPGRESFTHFMHENSIFLPLPAHNTNCSNASHMYGLTMTISIQRANPSSSIKGAGLLAARTVSAVQKDIKTFLTGREVTHSP